ncbi:PREDICTED: interferon-related developmental regulator 1-like isoform X2 [Fragaria vesca subsp. vesca]|uniref:interferon-related developmental regulator 1-like isoform X2 n=1 Tax=Fragaria vesca subsp. vesca TaxID=101020 RepID=UPI0002C2FAD4|nr:PREDICTED: interferon-related developmental regulator 1-like isoform X2 [Fragaria vesca subsp. vesca]
MSSRRGFSNTRARANHNPPNAMKKRGKQSGRAVADGYDDELPEKVIQTSRPRPLGPISTHLVEGLLEKRGDKREETLASMIEGLNANLSKNLLEEKFATFLYRCLNSVKKGSTKEVNNSFHVIGLLATIVGCENKLSEIYRELLPVLSGALKSGSTTIKILDCLSIVAFFGATNPDETQNAMHNIWEYLNPESGYVVNTKNNSAELLVAAIYAWLFLLSSMEGFRLSYSYWKGAISYFANLLDHDNNLVCGAASEALALIFETGSLEKFWNDESGSSPSYTQMQQSLRAHLLKRVNCAYLNLRTEKNAVKIRNVSRYFEGSHVLAESLVVKGKVLTLSSWYQIIQLQFLKRFLADGFKKHMEENEKLQNLFEFDPRKNKNIGPELYVATTDKISVRFFMPEERDQYMLTKEQRKKERVWRTSIVDKAKTQLMTKHRLLSKELKRCNYD